jgi:signal transduction histidine kinase
MGITGRLTIAPDEVVRRKSYLQITPEDEARLREAHPLIHAHAPRIIARFYEYLLGHEHTRRMLEAHGLIERLKELQLKYFLDLTSGRYDLEYFENRIRVGSVHHRIGLSPEWYIGAYLKYFHIVSDVLSTAFGRDHEKFLQTSLSLTKIMHLDMGLTLDAYHRSAQHALEEKTEELEASNARLRELQLSRQLLSDLIVHDLQNPLAGIQAFLQVMQRKLEREPEDVSQALEEALSSCTNLSDMILNVLHVSRAEVGRLEPYPEQVDLARLVVEATEPYRLLFRQEGREVVLEKPAKLTLLTDAHLVWRILQNLLRNALRHTPRGTRIVVRAEPLEDGCARLSVIDDGPGIPPEVQALLFEPLGAPKLRKAGVRVDTGLGLAFSRVASEALGAVLSVESDGKSGTSFHLLLPAGVPRGSTSAGTLPRRSWGRQAPGEVCSGLKWTRKKEGPPEANRRSP